MLGGPYREKLNMTEDESLLYKQINELSSQIDTLFKVCISKETVCSRETAFAMFKELLEYRHKLNVLLCENFDNNDENDEYDEDE